MRGAFVGIAMCLMLLLSGSMPERHAPYPPGYTPDPDGYGLEPHGWARIAASPLSARHDATAVWIDSRFLVVGGAAKAQNCSSARCPLSRGLRDGAAYDPTTDQWQRISDAPLPVLQAELVILDSDLYLLTRDQSGEHRRRALRYDPRADSWTRLPDPPARSGHFTTEPGTLLDVADSRSSAGPIDFALDPAGRRWVPRALPDDPIGASHDRRLFWADGDLVLFAKPGPRSSRATRVRTTTIWSSRGWSPPKTLPVLGSGPVMVDSTKVVFPDRGSRLGSDGRQHPAGAYEADGRWKPLPATMLHPMREAGITQTLLVGSAVLHDGLLLDTTSGTFRRPPDFIGRSRGRAAAATGAGLFVWGGTDERNGHDLADGYLLYP